MLRSSVRSLLLPWAPTLPSAMAEVPRLPTAIMAVCLSAPARWSSCQHCHWRACWHDARAPMAAAHGAKSNANSGPAAFGSKASTFLRGFAKLSKADAAREVRAARAARARVRDRERLAARVEEPTTEAATEEPQHPDVKPHPAVAATPATGASSWFEADAPMEPAPPHATSTGALAEVLGRPVVIVSRQFELASLLFSWEVPNKYMIKDGSGAVVGHIAEESTWGTMLLRQFLRTHRPFRATMWDARGRPVLHISRGFKLLSSHVTITDAVTGEPLGEICGRWHPLKRLYDLYGGLGGKQQFCRVSERMLSFQFKMLDESGRPLAVVDREWGGLLKEFVVDQGSYLVEYGPAMAPDETQFEVPGTSLQPHVWRAPPWRSTSNPTEEVVGPIRPLTLGERAIAIALAVVVDFDYFSRKSESSRPLSE